MSSSADKKAALEAAIKALEREWKNKPPPTFTPKKRPESAYDFEAEEAQRQWEMEKSHEYRNDKK